MLRSGRVCGRGRNMTRIPCDGMLGALRCRGTLRSPVTSCGLPLSGRDHRSSGVVRVLVRACKMQSAGHAGRQAAGIVLPA